MIIAVDLDFYKNIDKLLRDNYKYVQCCLLCLIETVSTQIIPSLLTTLKEAFGTLLTGQVKAENFKSNGIVRV